MNQVVALAAIAGAVSIVTSVIGALSTWSVSKHSLAARLAEIAAQAELLREEIRERERCRRLAVYQPFVHGFNKLFNTFGREADHERGYKLSNAYIPLVANVMLVGAPRVCEVADEANEIYEKIWPASEARERDIPAESPAERWSNVTKPIREELNEVGPRLMARMHDDVTRGVEGKAITDH